MATGERAAFSVFPPEQEAASAGGHRGATALGGELELVARFPDGESEMLLSAVGRRERRPSTGRS